MSLSLTLIPGPMEWLAEFLLPLLLKVEAICPCSMRVQFSSLVVLLVSWEKGGRGTTVGESRSYLARKAALMPATEHSRFFLLAPWSLPTSTSAVPLSHFKISKLRLRKFCEDASRTRSVSPGGTAAGSSWTGSDRWLAGQVLLVVVIAVWY